MKKMILGLAFSAGALFGAEPSSSSSHSNSNDDFYQMPQDKSERLGEQLLKESRVFLGHYEPTNKTIHHTYEPQIVRHEKGNLLEQATETAVHVSAQTFFSLLIQDVYSAGRNFLFPNEEEAFQESIAKLKLQQAQNSEKEREVGIQMAQANVKMVDEMRKLVTVVRTLSKEATKRTLSAEESELLNSAKYSLSILQGILNAASSAA